MEKAHPGLNRLLCATLEGNRALPVTLEATFTKGLPAFTIVGLGDDAIKESKERVKSALLTGGFRFPPLRITVHWTGIRWRFQC